MKIFSPGLLASVLAIAAATSGNAHQIKAKNLVIMHPWVHAAAAGSDGTDGFVVIKNVGTETEHLLGASLDGAGDAQLVQPAKATDTASLCRLETGIAIAPGTTVELKPQHSALLFGALKSTLRQDLYAAGTLTFAKAGVVTIEFFIEAAAAKAPSHAVMAACLP